MIDGFASEFQVLGWGEQFQFHAINNESARYLLHEYKNQDIVWRPAGVAT